MADRNTGFHPSDADWTRGRAIALADAEATARRQMGMMRKVTLTGTTQAARKQKHGGKRNG